MSAPHWKPIARINFFLTKRSLGTFDIHGKNAFIKAKTDSKKVLALDEAQKEAMAKKVAFYSVEEKKRTIRLSAITAVITLALIFSCIKIIQLL